jgi:hypothetical protein
MNSLLDTLAQSSLSIAIAGNPTIFPWAETIHVMAIALVFGTILIVDLRLLGLAANNARVSALTDGMLPITWVGFALAVITGALMFLTNPMGYFENEDFRIKAALLLLAGVNMAVFHLFTARTQASWDMPNIATPTGARVAGALSIAIWIGVIAAGRWIGFSLSPF